MHSQTHSNRLKKGKQARIKENQKYQKKIEELENKNTKAAIKITMYSCIRANPLKTFETDLLFMI